MRLRLIFVVLLLAALLCVGSIFYFQGFDLARIFGRSKTVPTAEDGTGSIDRYPKSLYILVLGLDASNRLSDVIIVVSIDREANRTRFLSIPRDTRVELEGHGFAKANSAYARGGINLAKKTFEKLLATTIAGYIIVDLDGFKQIVDSIGGIEVDVDKPMKYTDRAGGLFIDIPAGRQILDGEKAMEYVRYRSDGLADIGRIGRQQIFVRETVRKLIEKPDKIPAAITSLKQSVMTDLDFSDAIPLAVDFLHSLVLHQQDFMTLPGKAQYIDGVSYYLADASSAALGFCFDVQ